jgi:hypothetical protein
MRKRSGGFFIFALACVCLLVMAPMASAAVKKVICVPWQGGYHTAISGQPVNLYAVIYGDSTGGTVSYSWDFKDGSAPATGSIPVPANGIYNLQVTHTFTEALGAPFETELTIEGKSDAYNIMIGPDNNDSKVNIAIDRGLWYLHKEMIRANVGLPSVPGGYWDDGGAGGVFYVGRTGACVWAFEVQGHLLNVEADPLNPTEDPYVEDVQRGINYLLSRMFNQSMNAQTYGHPEDYDGNGTGDGNGYGLVCYYSGGHTNYEQGLAMGAIAGCGTPDATADTAYSAAYHPYVLNRTYKDIVQDMVDWYAWSQIDSTNFPLSGARGGWYYTAADNNNWSADYGDNSACQWAYIGLEAAKVNFGSTIPTWVKQQLAGYLHSQLGYSNRGWLSYRANYTTYPNVCLTGGALVGMALVGETIYDNFNGPGSYATDLSNVQTFMGNNWRGTEWRWTENWYGHRAYYTMYAVMKGFRLQGIESLPGSPGTSNWYGDYVSVMLPDQKSDGHWRGTGWIDGYIVDDMGTAFGILILTPSPLTPGPDACFDAEPNPGYLDIPIFFDASCSKHYDSKKIIVRYEWDWNNDGTYDTIIETPDGEPPGIITHTWDLSDGLGTYPVTLRVTDNTKPIPITDKSTLDINLTLPPHPPLADAGGPYMVSLCSGDSLLLDGSVSYDIDKGQSESGNPPFDTITAWNWDLDGSPWTYGNKSGETVLLNATDVATYFSIGSNTIGLKVADNTALAFPNSGQPNLTDEDFGKVTVYNACACDLAARAKSGKVQLVWTHTGAASYDIYRSTAGPNTGFVLIADNYVTTYATYLDTGLVNGTTYYYRVVSSDGCGSKAASGTPRLR